MNKIRVLVVDDSAFLRRTLPRLLESDPDIQVIGAAADGADGLRQVKELRPDVVTLDVLMPVMDGLTALRHIMRDVPTPVVMVSSVTHENAAETLEALALGAVEIVAKPSGPISLDIDKVSAELIDKVKAAYTTKIKLAAGVDVTRAKFRAILDELAQGRPQPSKARLRRRLGQVAGKLLVAIAASTGGPAALQLLLPRLPADLKAGIVIVQHIAEGFTRPLAERLNSLSHIAVREAQTGERIMPGVALLSPANVHLTVRCVAGELAVYLDHEPAQAIYRPSADVLFRSIAESSAGQTCAVILTGMGNDGALGMKAIRDQGGWTIAQDEATSVIYGMPDQAVKAGGVCISLPIGEIADEIVRVTA